LPTRAEDKKKRSRFAMRACCPNATCRLEASDADAFAVDREMIAAVSVKFRLGNSTLLETRVTISIAG
jgi:hypothetical protein